MEVHPFPRPDWEPLPNEGCRAVEGKVLLVQEGLVLALLRFEQHGTIHEHAAAHPIDVLCLEGRGMASAGEEVAEIAAGLRVRWPANVSHRLWTEGSTMIALMVEHLAHA